MKHTRIFLFLLIFCFFLTACKGSTPSWKPSSEPSSQESGSHQIREAVQNWTDGSTMKVSYDSNGAKTASFHTDKNGTHADMTYYPNGTVASSHEYGPTQDNKYYYDESGNKTAAKRKNPCFSLR